MEYEEMKKLFAEHESSHPEIHLTAYITFLSFGPENHSNYSWESRTYVVSSDNKAFQPDKGGYSIFGSCLDGTDCCLRLDSFMAEEHGGKDGWIVEECCILGYLLMEHAVGTITTPKLFYAIDKAQEEMLACIADFVKVDFTSLMMEYNRNRRRAVTDCYHAEKFNAYASTIKESGSWEIKTVYIRSMLDITIDDARR